MNTLRGKIAGVAKAAALALAVLALPATSAQAHGHGEHVGFDYNYGFNGYGYGYGYSGYGYGPATFGCYITHPVTGFVFWCPYGLRGWAGWGSGWLPYGAYRVG
jgi:hypothetical protein